MNIAIFLIAILACSGCQAFGFAQLSCGDFRSLTILQLRAKDDDSYSNINHLSGDHSVEMNRRDVLGATLRAATLVTTSARPVHAFSSSSVLPNANIADTFPSSLATDVPTVQLGNGTLKVSRTMQGYWQLAGGHGRYKESDAIANMDAHFKAGITTLDTADIYGPSETVVGKYVRSNSEAIPCTKFCCFRYLEEIDRSEVRTRITKACERLQVSKLPLVQLFWSDYSIKRYIDVALMLTELKEEGLIQEIGATNFDLKRLKEIKDAGVPLVSHQVQMSALDRRPVQSGMVDWCAENGVSLIAFGTVGSGILSDTYLGRTEPPTQEEKNTASMRMYSNTAARFGSWELVQKLLQTMNAIANDVKSSGRCGDANLSNVAQRYVLETTAVASVLIGVRNQNHIAENVRTHAFQLTSGEREAIDAVVAKRDGPRGDVWDIERGFV